MGQNFVESRASSKLEEKEAQKGRRETRTDSWVCSFKLKLGSKMEIKWQAEHVNLVTSVLTSLKKDTDCRTRTGQPIQKNLWTNTLIIWSLNLGARSQLLGFVFVSCVFCHTELRKEHSFRQCRPLAFLWLSGAWNISGNQALQPHVQNQASAPLEPEWNWISRTMGAPSVLSCRGSWKLHSRIAFFPVKITLAKIEKKSPTGYLEDNCECQKGLPEVPKYCQHYMHQHCLHAH